MNVGNGIAIGKLQRSVLLEKRDHARSRFKESVDHRRVEVLAQFMAQIGARLFDVFDDPGPTRQWMEKKDEKRETTCDVVRGLMKRLQMEDVEALALDS